MSQNHQPEKKKSQQGDSSKPKRTSPQKKTPNNNGAKISAKNKVDFNITVTKIAHIINPICRGLFKNYKQQQTNRSLRFPGAELQLIYNCWDPHIGKRPISEVAAHFKKELLESDALKKEYSQIHIIWVPFKLYVQIIITIVNDDLYKLLYAK